MSSRLTPSENCLAIIRHYEDFRPEAYICPAGRWTYGYGFTLKKDGSPVRKGDQITLEAAEQRLEELVNDVAINLYIALPRAEFTQRQLDALVSFTFNVGIGKFRGSSIYRVWKSGHSQAPDMTDLFMRWIYAAGKVQGGLVKRRATEAHLYLTGEVKLDWPDLLIESYKRKALQS